MTKFPLKLAAQWRQIYIPLLIGAVLGQGYSWLQGGSFSVPSVELMAVAAFYVGYMHLFHPMRAGASGLRLINGWGMRRQVAWESIVEVRHARQFGLLPSFRVLSDNGNVYWISSEIANLAGLHALATQYGGPEHPLALALATPQYALR
jgi:hypothetical protein